MSEASARFFDQHAEDYRAEGERAGMWRFHQVTAARIESEIDGRVLTIGGLWPRCKVEQLAVKPIVADRSLAMLRHDSNRTGSAVQCEALALAFADARLDHVILPLVLHHIAGRHGGAAREGARQAIRQAARALKPGGKIWISEFCVGPAVYGLELLASPLTHLVLAVARIPLVVMHSRAFYRRELDAAGFQDVAIETITAAGARPGDLIQPVIGLRWLLIPRFLYPIRPTLITARKKP